MHYQEYTPSLHLSPFIEKFWTLETDASDTFPMEFLGTPNGAEGFIINLRMGYKVIINNQLFNVPEVIILMPYSPWKILVEGHSKAIGVFFKAGSMYTLLKCSMTIIVDQLIELEAFLGSKAVRVLKEQVLDSTEEKGIAIMENFFSRYFSCKPYHLDTVGWTVQLIRQSNGTLSIEQIASKLGISRQAIARQFADKVGVSPKYYSRVIHFNSVQQYLKNNPKTSWSELTYWFNYFDQSHMIKDFYDFTGASPSGYADLISFLFSNEILPDMNLKLL